MSQNNDKEKVYSVEELFNGVLVKEIYKEILDSRKCVGEDKFTYDTLEKTIGDKTYIITPRHVPIRETMSHGKSSCKDCYGTGKKIVYMDKSKVPNTDDFVILASESIKGKTEEQLKAIIENEKKSKHWQVLLPCSCAIKQMYKKGMRIVANDVTNVIVEVTCTEKVMG